MGVAMDAQAKETFIRAVSTRNGQDSAGRRILWSRHAVTELAEEGWARRPVESALCCATVIEDYPAVHRPLPDCLVLGWLPEGVPFHAVVAVDTAKERLLVVTVYQPATEEWENDWRTRRM